MSIIQTLRDKAAWLLFILIAVALLGFILMDYSGRGGGVNNTVVGKVNGTNVYYQNFEVVYQQRLEVLKHIGANTSNEELIANVSNTLWQLYQNQIELDPIFKKAGFTVTDAEVQKVILGQFPVQEIFNDIVFQNPSTRSYDPNYATQIIQAWKNSKDPNDKILLDFYNQFVKTAILKQKYMSAFLMTANVPNWLKNEYAKENMIATQVAYVKVPYYAIPGNNPKKITDKDAEKFADKYEAFLPKGESRTIDYVSFNAAPTTADSLICYNEIEVVKTPFSEAKNADILINQSPTVRFNFINQYLPEKAYQILPDFDKIKNLSIGQVYGVYIGHFSEEPSYESNYILAKITGTKILPDSVKFRHLLVALPKEATQEQISAAKIKIDSLYAKLKKGENFATLIQQYSDDQTTKDKGGEYTFNYEQGLTIDTSLFNAIFEGRTGTTEIIKTIYGYHIIQVLSQTHPQKLYTIAIASRKIEASPETISKASAKAAQLKALVGENSTAKKFTNAANQLQLKVETSQPVPTNITAPFINNLYSREILRFMYKNDKNTVSDPTKVGNDYVIAMITNVYTGSESSLPSIIQYLTNREKIDNAYTIVSKQITNPSSLSAIADQYKQKEDSVSQVSFLNLIFGAEGIEPEVVGTSFNNMDLNKISKPIKGNTGIFFIKTTTKPFVVTTDDLNTLFRNKEINMMNNVFSNLYSNLTRNSTVKDYRNKFL